MRWLTLAVAAFLATGCVSYDGVGYSQLAEKASRASAVTAAECEAHVAAAAALREGPNSAIVLPLVGDAPRLEDVADEHLIAHVVCLDALRREMSPENQRSLLDAWNRIYGEGLKEVQ